MNFKIHKGTQEIGGSCIEIWTTTTRIIVDLGMPLVNSKNESFDFREYEHLSREELIDAKVLPNIQGSYNQVQRKVDGILISHYHQDHHGFLSFADITIPVYCGKATQLVIELGAKLFSDQLLKNRFINFDRDKNFTIGDIKIEPYLIDHSAFDAYAFLIESNGKRLFYSGDFRGHGRKNRGYRWFLHNAPTNVDYLIMEGTTIGREQQGFITEVELEQKLVKVFKSNNEITLINTSSQNIDRLVSIYRACKQTNKIMVVDIYTAIIMKSLAEFAKIPHPSASFPEVKVIYPYRISNMIVEKLGREILFEFSSYKITREEVSVKRKDIVMLVKPSMKRDIEKIESTINGVFIFSLWNGYMQEQKSKTFLTTFRDKGFSFKHIHTSGHADISTLKSMVHAIKPKYLVPIHTFNGDHFKDIFTSVDIHQVTDGEAIEIQ